MFTLKPLPTPAPFAFGSALMPPGQIPFSNMLMWRTEGSLYQVSSLPLPGCTSTSMIAIFGKAAALLLPPPPPPLRGGPAACRAAARTAATAAEIELMWQKPNGESFCDAPRARPALPTAWCDGGLHITNADWYSPCSTATEASINDAAAARAAVSVTEVQPADASPLSSSPPFLAALAVRLAIAFKYLSVCVPSSVSSLSVAFRAMVVANVAVCFPFAGSTYVGISSSNSRCSQCTGSSRWPDAPSSEPPELPALVLEVVMVVVVVPTLAPAMLPFGSTRFRKTLSMHRIIAVYLCWKYSGPNQKQTCIHLGQPHIYIYIC